MNVLVTGATGFIGYHVAKLLHESGHSVRALVRSGSDESELRAIGLEVAHGDIRNFGSLDDAMRGCTQVYHIAADYRLWVPEPAPMYATNVQGTRNVMEAALRNSVNKVIYTSTVGVLPAASDGRPSNEDSRAALNDMVGHYKKSKFLAERAVLSFVDRGLPVVIVNPSTPIGSFDRKPTPTGKIIVDFLSDRMPGYVDTGLNFVDVEDVAAGHVLAAQYGKVGQRYILGNRNITLREFLELLARAGGKKAPVLRFPYYPILIAAHIDEAITRWIPNRQPRIPVAGVKMAHRYMYFDSAKAVRELRFPQHPIEHAIEKAIRWFRDRGYIRTSTA